MLIKRPSDVLSSEITDEPVYLKRRELLKMAGITVAGALSSHSVLAAASVPGANGKELTGIQKSPLQHRPGSKFVVGCDHL